MRPYVRASVLGTTLALTLSTAALAQTPSAAQPAAPPAQAHVSGGGGGDIELLVTAVHHVTNKGESTTYAPGWQVGASYQITRVISVIGHLTGDYDGGVDRTGNIYTYAGGARFQWKRDTRFRPFAQVVFGAGQDNGIGVASSETNHYPVLSPGGGGDIAAGKRVAIRLRFDVPILMRFSDSFLGTRFAVGISVPFGGQ